MCSQQTARPRAVFLDVDGTYAEHGVVPDAHVQAVRTARRLGHLVFVCTGRPLAMVPGHILDAGFDGVITGAGARVDVGREVLKDERFEPGLASLIVETLDAHNAAYILEAPESLHGRTGVDRRLRQVLGPVFAERPQHDGVLATDVDPLEDILGPMQYSDDLRSTSFAKVSCFDSPVPLQHLGDVFGPHVGLIPSSLSALGDGAGEIFMTGVHKALGIQAVEAHLGLNRADIIAIGDSSNDLEMLEYAGVGIGVEGGHPAVLAIADRLTAGPGQNGVALAFAELGLLD